MTTPIVPIITPFLTTQQIFLHLSPTKKIEEYFFSSIFSSIE